MDDLSFHGFLSPKQALSLSENPVNTSISHGLSSNTILISHEVAPLLSWLIPPTSSFKFLLQHNPALPCFQTSLDITKVEISTESHSALHRIQTNLRGRQSKDSHAVALRFSLHSNAWACEAKDNSRGGCTPLFIAFKPPLLPRFPSELSRCTPLFIAFKRNSICQIFSIIIGCTPLFIAFKHSYTKSLQSQDWGCTPLFIAFKHMEMRGEGKIYGVALRSSSHSNDTTNKRRWNLLTSCTPLFIAFKPQGSSQMVKKLTIKLHSALHRIQTSTDFRDGMQQIFCCTPLFIAFKRRCK